jgi:hypothetical protein
MNVEHCLILNSEHMLTRGKQPHDVLFGFYHWKPRLLCYLELNHSHEEYNLCN